MALDPITAVLDIGGKIIDKLFPDKTEADKAKLELAKMQVTGELNQLGQLLEYFIAEAKSSDKWTSRARPSFFYVMYVYILWAIPMGILSIFSPESATKVAEGMGAWLRAVPKEMWGIFGAGFSIYTVARSYWDKRINGKGGGL